MPDFEARLVGAGVTLVAWADPPAPVPYASPGPAPSRLNVHGAYPPTYYRVAPGSMVEVRAIVGGVEAPLDAALGGRLFTAWWAQWSDFPPTIVQPAGQSSVARFALNATVGRHLGFFHLGLGRTGGGALFVPFCVEVP